MVAFVLLEGHVGSSVCMWGGLMGAMLSPQFLTPSRQL